MKWEFCEMRKINAMKIKNNLSVDQRLNFLFLQLD